jgi:hypothetical protein
LWNGRHPDGLGPVNLVRWYEFLEFNLAQRVPHMNPLVRAFAPTIVAGVFGFEDVEFEPDRWYEQFGDDYTAARAAYDAEEPIRVVYESGVGADEIGEPGGTFEQTFTTWPPPESQPTTWYLGEGGSLDTAAPVGRGGGVDAIRFDPDAGQRRLFPDGDYPLLAPVWPTDWSQFDEGNVLSYLTPPLTENLVITARATPGCS